MLLTNLARRCAGITNKGNMQKEIGNFMVQTCPTGETYLVENWVDHELFSDLALAEERVNELAATLSGSYDRVQIIDLDCDVLELWKQ